MTVLLNYQEVFNRLIKPSSLNRFFQPPGIETTRDWDREARLHFDERCLVCRKLRLILDSNREPLLEAVRFVIIELYCCIFQYQMWDVRTGEPVLKHLFAGDAQLDAFTYFSQFGYVFSDFIFQMVFSGVCKARSICNIAVLSAINCIIRLGILCRNVFKRELEKCKKIEIKMQNPEKGCEISIFDYSRCRDTFMQLRRLQEILRSRSTKTHYQTWDALSTLRGVIQFLWETARGDFVDDTDDESFTLQTLNKFYNEAFTFDVCSSIPKGFQNLVHEMNEKICLCLSPERKWVIAAEEFIKIIPRSQEHSRTTGRPQGVSSVNASGFQNTRSQTTISSLFILLMEVLRFAPYLSKQAQFSLVCRDANSATFLTKGSWVICFVPISKRKPSFYRIYSVLSCSCRNHYWYLQN